MSDQRSPHQRIVRLGGMVGLALRRTWWNAIRTAPRRFALGVLGVAIPIALLLAVLGVSFGLAGQTTVYGENVDYWIVPESGSAATMVVSVDGPQLGEVHRRTATLSTRPGVEYATPVLVELVRARAGSGDAEYVLAVGVVPGPGLGRVAGVPTAPLQSGDPHYANGTYDGPRTGEVVVSPAMAETLNASAGDRMTVASTDLTTPLADFDVQAVAGGDGGPMGSVPIAVVHLSELQAITGATDVDSADQILVRTESVGVREELSGVFPQSSVVTKSGLGVERTLEDDLSLAVALTAVVVATFVGVAFVATTMGFEIAADRRSRAILAAVGIGRFSRTVLVLTRTVVVALLGGLLGIALGVGCIVLTNAVATHVGGLLPIATLHPLLVVIGFGVSVGIGLLVGPYVLLVSRRTTTDHSLNR